jgi:hypothetical protein
MQIRCVFRRSGRGRIEGGLRFRIGPTGLRGGWGTLTQGFTLPPHRHGPVDGDPGLNYSRVLPAGRIERPGGLRRSGKRANILSW